MSNHKISIVMPVYNVKEKYLIDAISSVFNQVHTDWELCIADASDDNLTKFIKPNDKIKVVRIKNESIASNTNKALELATGDFVTFLDHDDLLSEYAVYRLIEVINAKPDVDIIYSDEDKVDEINYHKNPFFKPMWSPDMLNSYNYICHLTCYRKSLIDSLGGLREGFNGAQDYDLILRATEKTNKIHHIPKVLYSWRMSENSTAQDPNSKPYTHEAAKKALTEHFERMKVPAEVKDGLFVNSFKIEYQLEVKPLVSIVICNRNQKKMLENCIKSIIQFTTYPNYEIIIVENNSDQKEIFDFYNYLQKKMPEKIKIVYWNEQPFNFSQINNFGVQNASSEYVLLLNNDTQVINHDWLENMMVYAVRKDVGIVGAKLYYQDGTIQHAGVVIDGKVPTHVSCKAPHDALGYMGRLKIVQNVSCVTGACLLTKKSIWNEVGGLDMHLALAFNDVDYCFKVFNKAYRIVWTPYAELYHFESKTRGYEDTPEKQKRFQGELRYLLNTWEKFLLTGDKMYRTYKGVSYGI